MSKVKTTNKVCDVIKTSDGVKIISSAVSLDVIIGNCDFTGQRKAIVEVEFALPRFSINSLGAIEIGKLFMAAGAYGSGNEEGARKLLSHVTETEGPACEPEGETET